jgi:CubicO group peptidase (beta-lactamase class C family)/transposase-like protein
MGRWRLLVGVLGSIFLLGVIFFVMSVVVQQWNWSAASPESQGMISSELEATWTNLKNRNTTAFLVIRNDRIVFERYAAGYSRTRPHYTASMAKALVGGVALMVAMDDGRIQPDELASKYIPKWISDSWKSRITIRHLATHTSGIEDATEGKVLHRRLTGWKGDFWKRLAPPLDPFTLARDVAPVLEAPGTKARYSNTGAAMLSYCVTAALRGAKDNDLRSLLKHRIMDPIGVPDAEWSCGYNSATSIDGMTLVASWGGGSYSPNATARVGRLMLHRGDWQGRQLISEHTVKSATTYAGMPNYYGLGWWTNRGPNGARAWRAAPDDAFAAEGGGQQFLLVIPSLKLIVVRNGEFMDQNLSWDAGLDTYIITPVMNAFAFTQGAPYPPSPIIKTIAWEPPSTIIRKARGSDNWPLTWGDDDLYAAYGDGYGFDPMVPEKLSLGFAKISGFPPDFHGVNLRSPTGEQKGDGKAGKKASGLLMVDGVLYMWVRNAGNSQLAWSNDHGKTWTWSDWRFTASFGCPTFLNFGNNYEGSRDGYIYVYSHDSDSAYLPADGMVLARVPKARITSRDAYEFFDGLDVSGSPLWTKDIAQRDAVFTHPGKCYRSSVSYDAALKRYLWCQTLPGGDTRFEGGFGIYDAPEPWGPWTTAYFTEHWDVGVGETSSFPTKWMSDDGKTLYLVFSGSDSFSVRFRWEKPEDLSMSRSRRFHSVSFKRQVVLEVVSGQSSRATLSRRYELSPSLIRNWEKAYHEGRLDEGARQDVQGLEARIRELERMVGKLTMENEFLKKVEELSRRKENGKPVIVSGTPWPSKGRAKRSKFPGAPTTRGRRGTRRRPRPMPTFGTGWRSWRLTSPGTDTAV